MVLLINIFLTILVNYLILKKEIMTLKQNFIFVFLLALFPTIVFLINDLTTYSNEYFSIINAGHAIYSIFGLFLLLGSLITYIFIYVFTVLILLLQRFIYRKLMK
ncbi:hypothetical protein NCCP28_36900 [Niallia sp. NCCP-28]|nr:hypothetical protein NCCP28_36900 [Niallia sp. NCCP-28]